jgi:hypothetical protein
MMENAAEKAAAMADGKELPADPPSTTPLTLGDEVSEHMVPV